MSKIASIDVEGESEIESFENHQQFFDSVFNELPAVEKSLYQIPLANKYYSPRIIAHYNYYNKSVLPVFEKQLIKKCGYLPNTWLQFNDVVYCKPDDVFALMTDTKEIEHEILPFDRIIGEKGPLLIFYSNIHDENFKPFMESLFDAANFGKFRFIWRYTPRNIQQREVLNGFGVDLTLKRTDYLVIDDRDLQRNSKRLEILKEGAEEIGEDPDRLELYEVLNNNQIAQLSEEDLKTFGLKFSSYVLQSSSNSNSDALKLEKLSKMIEDLPKFTPFLSKAEINKELEKQVDYNTKIGLVPELPNVFINGLILDETKQDVFSLYKTIKQEYNLIKSFNDLNISSPVARSLISKFASHLLLFARTNSMSRFDIAKNNKALIYFNDIEKDKEYARLPTDPSIYLQKFQPGQVPPLRQNTHEIIFVIDLTSSEKVDLLKEILNSIVSQGIPQRFGLIPMIDTENDRILANNLYSIIESKGIKKGIEYLSEIISPDFKIKSLTDKDYTSEFVQPFLERFDIEHESIVVNGVIQKFTDQWPYFLRNQLMRDVSLLQNYIYTSPKEIEEPLRDILFEDAKKFRNSLAIPNSRELLEFRNLNDETLKNLKSSPNDFFEIDVGNQKSKKLVTITLGGNFGSKLILEQLLSIVKYSQKTKYNISLRLINTNIEATFIGRIHQLLRESLEKTIETLESILSDHQFTELSKNPVMDSYMKLSNIKADNFLLVSGRYIELEEKPLSFEIFGHLIDHEFDSRISMALKLSKGLIEVSHRNIEKLTSILTLSYEPETKSINNRQYTRVDLSRVKSDYSICLGDKLKSDVHIVVSIDPTLEISQKFVKLVEAVKDIDFVSINIILQPKRDIEELPIKRFFRGNYKSKVSFDSMGNLNENEYVSFDLVPKTTLFTLDLDLPPSWIVVLKESYSDLDNVLLTNDGFVTGYYELKNLIIEGHAYDVTSLEPPTGLSVQVEGSDTNVMSNYNYLQLKANPGLWNFEIMKNGRSSEIYSLLTIDDLDNEDMEVKDKIQLSILNMDGARIFPRVVKNPGKENESLIRTDEIEEATKEKSGFLSKFKSSKKSGTTKNADINIFTIASGHLYERFLSIMTASVMRHTKHTVKFWLIENYMSPSFKAFLPKLSEKYGFEYELVTYKWPLWLRGQREKQRTIWGYKILFLDVLFPQELDKVIFVDADQIVRTDLKELIDIDLEGAPYGYTPMGDSRKEMEGFRFWKQGYWKKFLGDKLKYHISALYVIDLKKFRQIGAGDILRQHYHQLSRDPGSLSNLDQDLPNNLQTEIKIFSLPQEWLWCETWCDDESLKTAKTIDLCNNPLTKEPKLDRARRQIPEWTEYDNEINALREEMIREQEEALHADMVQGDDNVEAVEEEGIDHDEL